MSPKKTSDEGCLYCARDLCEECGDCNCCANEGEHGANGGTFTNPPSATIGQENTQSNSKRGSRTRKDAESVRDPKSTGRKRAAVDFPLNFADACEWRGLANAGGGKFPIIGCMSGMQQARHHGPDKNTLNNSVGNVHRICDECHNIWHARNDPDYDPSLGHVPRIASKEELLDRKMKIRYCLSEPGFAA